MPVDVQPKPRVTEVYLGDGLYAGFDGYQLYLRAPRENGDHYVYLELAVYLALRDFAAKCWELKA